MELNVGSVYAQLIANSTQVATSCYKLKVKENDLPKLNGNSTSQVFMYSIGKSNKCDIVVDDISLLSKMHCTIFCSKNNAQSTSKKAILDVYITDSSSNGTFVNQLRVMKGKTRQLHHGDSISLIAHQMIGKSLDNVEITEDIWKKHTFTVMIPHEQEHAKTTPDDIIGSPVLDPNDENTPHMLELLRTLKMNRKLLDFYTVRNRLGEGTFGTVHECVEKETGQQYALKILDIRKIYNTKRLSLSDSYKATLEEALVLKQLRHPHILQLHDVFSEGYHIYFILELCKGGDLFDRVLTRKGYSEDKTRIVARQLFEAIEYMHSNNMVHRDLKLENVLLESPHDDLKIKISGTSLIDFLNNNKIIVVVSIDFGTAKDDRLGLKTYCGTPQYFAPEICRRDPSYSLKVDIWSLAMMLIIMICASYPISETDCTKIDVITRYVQNKEYKKALHMCSPEFLDFIGRCLEVDANQRMSAHEALQHPWLAGKREDHSTKGLSETCVDTHNNDINTVPSLMSLDSAPGYQSDMVVSLTSAATVAFVDKFNHFHQQDNVEAPPPLELGGTPTLNSKRKRSLEVDANSPNKHR